MNSMIFLISVNFEVTISFLAIRLIDAGRLSDDSYWLASDYNFFKVYNFITVSIITVELLHG